MHYSNSYLDIFAWTFFITFNQIISKNHEPLSVVYTRYEYTVWDKDMWTTVQYSMFQAYEVLHMLSL